MTSPLLEVNSPSLGGWVTAVGGVNVAQNELVSVRLADSAGVKFWDFAIEDVDDIVVAPPVTVDEGSFTATFTSPTNPTDGWALIFRSTVGIRGPGIDNNYVVRDDFTTTVGMFFLAPAGLRVGAKNETLEGDARSGYVSKINAVIRHPPGSGATPEGPAGGDLGSTFPNPSVLKLHGASIGAAGALVTGNAPYVSGASALTYSALNLAGGSGWVTGALPIANLATGSADGQVLTDAAGVNVWAKLVDANIAVGAGILPSKLGQAGATSAQVLAWSGSAWAPATPSVSLAGLAGGGASTGQALIWTGSAWAPGSNFGAQNILTSGTLGAGAGTFTSLTDSSLGLGVVHSSSGGAFTSSLLVNADVSASAAIAGSKVTPAFGSQNISTTGTLSAGATTVTGLTDAALGAGVVHSSAGGVLSIAAVDLTTEVTGVLPAANLPTLLVSKLNAGGTANRVVLTTDGATVTLGQVDLATSQVTGILPAANLAPAQMQSTATLTTLAAIPTSTFNDCTQCMVRSIKSVFTLDKTDTTTPNGFSVIAANPAGTWSI